MTIKFYSTRGEHGAFSNFSAHPITLDGKTWPTTEHYFQAMKFPKDAERQERIRTAKGPKKAKEIAWEKDAKPVAGWDTLRLAVMRRALRAKFTQHADLKDLLLSTGDDVLVEHTANDNYWGDGGDGSGKNMLGHMLMELRTDLRREHDGQARE